MAGAHSSLILAKLDTPHIAALGEQRSELKLWVLYNNMNDKNNTIQLTSDDYENIYLRLKDRTVKWIGIVVSLVLAPYLILSAIGFNSVLDLKIEETVKTQLEKEELAKKIEMELKNQVVKLSADMVLLEKRIEDANNKTKDLALFVNNFPIGFDDNQIVISDEQGKKLVIERGEVESTDVSFISPFIEPPLVLISSHGMRSRGVTKVFSIKKDSFVIDTNEFRLKSHWIAIGYK